MTRRLASLPRNEAAELLRDLARLVEDGQVAIVRHDSPALGVLLAVVRPDAEERRRRAREAEHQ